ncbi:hypothetical protein GIX45_04920 [Erwinia sp. CPCC 100877]|nr:hypothetical protein [Erwinia sp. CPCC 100877]
MKKGMLLCILLALSGVVYGAESVYAGPDCSKDTDGRIFSGLWDSMFENPGKYKKYTDDIGNKDTTFKIKRLSSERISKKEAKRLMLRRAKMDGIKESEINDSGVSVQYLKTELYRQYYLIESSKGFKAIAEYYSAVARDTPPQKGKIAVSCGADLEKIYIVSDSIDGHTADFATP